MLKMMKMMKIVLIACNRKTLIPGSRSKWAMGGKEEVGNQYVKERGQGVAIRNSPLLGAGKKKQDFSPLLQPGLHNSFWCLGS